jgi:hypothetical protein
MKLLVLYRRENKSSSAPYKALICLGLARRGGGRLPLSLYGVNGRINENKTKSKVAQYPCKYASASHINL